MKDSRGGGSDGKTCSLPNGIRTGPVTNDVVADSRDQPHKRAHSTNAGTVTTTHGLPTRIARNTRAGPVPSTCEAAQPPRSLTIANSGGNGVSNQLGARVLITRNELKIKSPRSGRNDADGCLLLR
jgi:hypothetical protein